MLILLDPAHGHNTPVKRSPDCTLLEYAYTRDLANQILISLHINAAGDGTKWMNATGWSCYTCKGQTESDRLADSLYQAAKQILKNKMIRTDYARDGDPDWEENFYILRHSLCPAVLTENFFMDGLDMDFLQSLADKQAIVDTHLEGITDFLKSISSDHHLRNSPTI